MVQKLKQHYSLKNLKLTFDLFLFAAAIPKCAGCTEPILDRFILKVLERTLAFQVSQVRRLSGSSQRQVLQQGRQGLLQRGLLQVYMFVMTSSYLLLGTFRIWYFTMVYLFLVTSMFKITIVLIIRTLSTAEVKRLGYWAENIDMGSLIEFFCNSLFSANPGRIMPVLMEKSKIKIVPRRHWTQNLLLVTLMLYWLC